MGTPEHTPEDLSELQARLEKLELANAELQARNASLERAVREYELLRKSSTNAWYLLAPDFTILNFNRYGKELAEEVWHKPFEKGLSMLDFSPDELRAEFVEKVKTAFGGQEVSNQREVPHPDGKRFYYNVKYTPVRDLQNNTWAVSFAVENITDTYTKTLELQESEKRFRELANEGTALIWMTDETDQLVFLSESWARELDDDIDTVYAQYFRYAHPDDLDDFNSAYATAKAQQTELEITVRIRNHSGNYALYTYHARPRTDANGHYLGMIGSATNQDRLLQEKAHLERLSLVAKHTKDGIIITGPDRLITWVNAAYCEITGYSSEEAIGRSPGALLQGADTDPATVAKMQRRFRAGKDVDVEILNYKKNGEPFWQHLVINPVCDDAGDIVRYIAVQRDITERRRLQAELDATNKRFLEVALKSQEQERKRIAEELHDGLGVSLSVASMRLSLLHDIDLNNIHPSAYKTKVMDLEIMLRDVMKDVRAISHNMHPPALEMLGLGAAINQLLNKSIADAGIELQTDIDTQLLDAFKDQHALMLYRIVQELVNNIVKHAQAQTVSVTVQKQDAESMFCEVRDDGVGFEVEAFKTGRGLGSDSVLSRLQLLGAELTIDSAPGAGAAFRCELPLPA